MLWGYYYYHVPKYSSCYTTTVSTILPVGSWAHSPASAASRSPITVLLKSSACTTSTSTSISTSPLALVQLLLLLLLPFVPPFIPAPALAALTKVTLLPPIPLSPAAGRVRTVSSCKWGLPRGRSMSSSRSSLRALSIYNFTIGE